MDEWKFKHDKIPSAHLYAASQLNKGRPTDDKPTYYTTGDKEELIYYNAEF